MLIVHHLNTCHTNPHYTWWEIDLPPGSLPQCYSYAWAVMQLNLFTWAAMTYVCQFLISWIILDFLDKSHAVGFNVWIIILSRNQACCVTWLIVTSVCWRPAESCVWARCFQLTWPYFPANLLICMQSSASLSVSLTWSLKLHLWRFKDQIKSFSPE